MPGVQKVLKVRDTAVAVVAGTWWHAGARRAAGGVGRSEQQGSSATIAETLKGPASTPTRLRRQPEWRRQRPPPARQKVEAVYAYPYPRLMLRWADERHGVTRPRSAGLGATQTNFVRGSAGRVRTAGRPCESEVDLGELRPARRVPGLRTRYPDKRARHAGKLLWSRDEDARPVHRSCSKMVGVRQGQQPDRPAHAARANRSLRVFPQNLDKGGRSPSRVFRPVSTRSAIRSRTF